ncbi:MAG: sulfatase-like hydrolase/transferase [Tissierellia bacterium]|nr:sulfatase-like hydrolase/transferase [Tissierellia bacterium]
MIINSDSNIEDKNIINKFKNRPNFLIIMVDEQRFPPPYEDDRIKEWRKKYLRAQNFLRNNGAEFKNHYAASTACSPGRASIYTGQYPSLHGVSQTDGGGETAFSPEIFWVGPEPHGSSPFNSGSSSAIGLSGRDVVYAREVIELIKRLDHQDAADKSVSKPWAIVASFVNPKELKKDHTEVHHPVGRDLTPLIFGKDKSTFEKEPVYFMTDDDPSRTLNHANPLGIPIEPVTQPCHLETVIVKLPTGRNNDLETWKYTRYFDNPQFWTNPGSEDKNDQEKCTVPTSTDTTCKLCVTSVKTSPVPDEIEMYNLTKDPTETKNLANSEFATVETMAIQATLNQILSSQCKKKRWNY